MSLFVFGSVNNISKGLISAAARSGKFEKVVCGDVFPDLCARVAFLKFRDTLPEADRKKVSDATVTTKEDLIKRINEASQVLYSTHAYYLNAPSNINLLNSVAKYSKGKRMVAVTPVELDNYLEENPQEAAVRAENEALAANPLMTLVKSDLTMGRFSHVLASIYLRRLATKQGAFLAPTNDSPYPIDAEDLADIALAALLSKDTAGKKFFAKGGERLSFLELLAVMEKQTGIKADLNSSTLDKFVSPASTDIARRIILENVYRPDYLNACRFVAGYKAVNIANYESAGSLKPQLKKVADSMTKANLPVEGITRPDLQTRVLRRIVN